jgi:hypothetical protein
MSRGIDYGRGQTNIDLQNGIRFGVISQNAVLQAWADSSEGDYGEAHCPKCGNEAIAIDDERVPDLDDGAEDWEDNGRDYACASCKYTFDSDEAFSDEPLGFVLDDDEYKATAGDDGDIFILRSPYYTRAQFCSPCAPGACYLENPCDDGERAYCFSHDWFDDGRAPYPVYRVSDDSLVPPAVEQWHRCADGPWEAFSDAQAFGEAEIGAKNWRITEVDGLFYIEIMDA